MQSFLAYTFAAILAFLAIFSLGASFHEAAMRHSNASTVRSTFFGFLILAALSVAFAAVA